MKAEHANLTAALAAVDDFCSVAVDDRSLLVRAKVRALVCGYHHAWQSAGYVPLAVEQVWQADLWNPETNAKSRTFQLAGKIDVLAELNGRTFIFDHKTTSFDITKPDAPYWRQLAVEGQVTHYFLLQWLHGTKPDGAVWDVVRKPGISPKALTKAERVSAVAERRYFSRSLSSETLSGLQTCERETLEMYEARLAHDCTKERPEWYFQRRPVPRLDHEILEYARELWDHGQEIIASRRTGRRPRNSGACMLYGSPCRYLGVCSGHDSIDSDRWQRRPNLFAELEGEASGDLLTNSRVRCFQTCRRKHHYDYELGVERSDEEEKESLFFGSAFHAGINAWWRAQLPEAHHEHHSESGCPTIAVGEHVAATELSARDTHGSY